MSEEGGTNPVTIPDGVKKSEVKTKKSVEVDADGIPVLIQRLLVRMSSGGKKREKGKIEYFTNVPTKISGQDLLKLVCNRYIQKKIKADPMGSRISYVNSKSTTWDSPYTLWDYLKETKKEGELKKLKRVAVTFIPQGRGGC